MVTIDLNKQWFIDLLRCMESHVKEPKLFDQYSKEELVLIIDYMKFAMEKSQNRLTEIRRKT